MLLELKSFLSIWVVIPLMMSIGLYLSLRFKFIQCTHLFTAWKMFITDRDPTGKRASSFSAVSAVLGGNLGTGNISGIAVAISLGGPGALFWMWVMATLGAVLKFINCALAILYRQQDERGEFVGGPMYYLTKGLNHPRLAKLYAILTIGAALSVGNLVQMHSLSLPFVEAGVPPVAVGLVMAMLVGAVIIGGLHRFSQVVSFVVPFMAILYVLSCLLILALNVDKILPAFLTIIQAAFHPSPILGGVAGFTVLKSIAVGFDRGLFATDVGVGIDAIIHASVESSHSKTKTALMQGLISTLSPLIVMMVCTLTGLVLIMTNAWLAEGLNSTNICIEGFRRGLHGQWAGHIITLTLFFFAFTTILTWSFCADKAIEFLTSTKMIKVFQMIFVICIPFGAFMHVNSVWLIADLFMNLMLIINVFALLKLFGHVKALLAKRDAIATVATNI